MNETAELIFLAADGYILILDSEDAEEAPFLVQHMLIENTAASAGQQDRAYSQREAQGALDEGVTHDDGDAVGENVVQLARMEMADFGHLVQAWQNLFGCQSPGQADQQHTEADRQYQIHPVIEWFLAGAHSRRDANDHSCDKRGQLPRPRAGRQKVVRQIMVADSQ